MGCILDDVKEQCLNFVRWDGIALIVRENVFIISAVHTQVFRDRNSDSKFLLKYFHTKQKNSKLRNKGIGY